MFGFILVNVAFIIISNTMLGGNLHWRTLYSSPLMDIGCMIVLISDDDDDESFGDARNIYLSP